MSNRELYFNIVRCKSFLIRSNNVNKTQNVTKHSMQTLHLSILEATDKSVSKKHWGLISRTQTTSMPLKWKGRRFFFRTFLSEGHQMSLRPLHQVTRPKINYIKPPPVCRTLSETFALCLYPLCAVCPMFVATKSANTHSLTWRMSGILFRKKISLIYYWLINDFTVPPATFALCTVESCRRQIPFKCQHTRPIQLILTFLCCAT